MAVGRGVAARWLLRGAWAATAACGAACGRVAATEGGDGVEAELPARIAGAAGSSVRASFMDFFKPSTSPTICFHSDENSPSKLFSSRSAASVGSGVPRGELRFAGAVGPGGGGGLEDAAAGAGRPSPAGSVGPARGGSAGPEGRDSFRFLSGSLGLRKQSASENGMAGTGVLSNLTRLRNFVIRAPSLPQRRVLVHLVDRLVGSVRFRHCRLLRFRAGDARPPGRSRWVRRA